MFDFFRIMDYAKEKSGAKGAKIMKAHKLNPYKILTIVTGIIFIIPFCIQAAGPETISYQGRIKTSGGIIPPDGLYSMRFSLWNARNAVQLQHRKWEETYLNSVPLIRGVFSVELGSQTPFPYGIFMINPNLWLEVQVDLDGDGFEATDVYLPRVPFEAVPYSFVSDAATTSSYALSAKSADDSEKLGGYPPGAFMDKPTYDSDKDGIIDEGALPSLSGEAEQLIANFVVASGESVSVGHVVCFINGKVKKGSRAPTAGTEFLFNDGQTTSLGAVKISPTKFIVAYKDVDNSNYGVAKVGEISGDTLTFGSPSTFNSSTTAGIEVAVLSETKIVVIYRDSSSSWAGTAKIATISGNSITFGLPYQYNGGDSVGCHVPLALNDSKFVIVFSDSGNSSYGTAIVGNISDTTITYGTEQVFNSDSTTYISAANLNSERFVAGYKDSGNSSYGTVIAAQVSGDSISFGQEYVFNHDISNEISVAAISGTRFILVYQDFGTYNFGMALLGTISGKRISLGEPCVFSEHSQMYNKVTVLNDSQILIGFRDKENNDDYGTVVLGEIVGETIRFGQETLFNEGVTSDIYCLPLTDIRTVIAFEDSSNSWKGTAVICDLGVPVGIAKEAAGADESVPVIIQGISDVHAGLTSGQNYFADPDGNLVKMPNLSRVGFAVSANKLLLDFNR